MRKTNPLPGTGRSVLFVCLCGDGFFRFLGVVCMMSLADEVSSRGEDVQRSCERKKGWR